jgi:hypothetical protein
MGIQFHVPRRRKQVIFVQDARAEPSLEELPAYAFREVLQSGIAPVRFAERPGKRGLLMGDGYDMDVVGHKAPAEDVHAEAPCLLGKEPKVSAAFLIPVKHLHRADAPLGYMVGVTRNNDA